MLCNSFHSHNSCINYSVNKSTKLGSAIALLHNPKAFFGYKRRVSTSLHSCPASLFKARLHEGLNSVLKNEWYQLINYFVVSPMSTIT